MFIILCLILIEALIIAIIIKSGLLNNENHRGP